MSRSAATSSGLPFSPVKLPAQLTSANLAEHDLEDDAVYRSLEYVGLDLSLRNVRMLEVERCRFADARLSGITMVNSTLTESVIDNCDLANIDARDSSLTHSRVSGSRMTGSTWSTCSFREVLFDSCRIDLASFRFARFRRTVFRGCNLLETDFQNADLRNIRFESCDLTGAKFGNAQMEGTRFADCTLLAISGVTSFAGAIVRSDDALSLAHTLAGALGITIES